MLACGPPWQEPVPEAPAHVARAAQHGGALLEGQRRPGPLRLDGAQGGGVHVVRRRLADLADDVAGRGLHRVVGAAAAVGPDLALPRAVLPVDGRNARTVRTRQTPAMRNAGVGSWPERRLRISPDRDALWFEGTTMSHRELALRVRRTAGALAALGVRAGDRVAWISGNHPSALETLYACG